MGSFPSLLSPESLYISSILICTLCICVSVLLQHFAFLDQRRQNGSQTSVLRFLKGALQRIEHELGSISSLLPIAGPPPFEATPRINREAASQTNNLYPTHHYLRRRLRRALRKSENRIAQRLEALVQNRSRISVVVQHVDRPGTPRARTPERAQNDTEDLDDEAGRPASRLRHPGTTPSSHAPGHERNGIRNAIPDSTPTQVLRSGRTLQTPRTHTRDSSASTLVERTGIRPYIPRGLRMSSNALRSREVSPTSRDCEVTPVGSGSAGIEFVDTDASRRADGGVRHRTPGLYEDWASW